MSSVLFFGCTLEEWVNADLQLDITGDTVHDEERIRICVQGTGTREMAAGDGLLAYPGIVTSEGVVVTVDRLDGQRRTYRAGPITFEPDQQHATATWAACGDDCDPCAVDTDSTQREGSWLLAVRLSS